MTTTKNNLVIQFFGKQTLVGRFAQFCQDLTTGYSFGNMVYMLVGW